MRESLTKCWNCDYEVGVQLREGIATCPECGSSLYALKDRTIERRRRSYQAQSVIPGVIGITMIVVSQFHSTDFGFPAGRIGHAAIVGAILAFTWHLDLLIRIRWPLKSTRRYMWIPRIVWAFVTATVGVHVLLLALMFIVAGSGAKP